MTHEQQPNKLYTIKNGSVILATEVRESQIPYIKQWFAAVYGI